MFRTVKITYVNGDIKYIPAAAEAMYEVKRDLDRDPNVVQWEVLCNK